MDCKLPVRAKTVRQTWRSYFQLASCQSRCPPRNEIGFDPVLNYGQWFTMQFREIWHLEIYFWWYPLWWTIKKWGAVCNPARSNFCRLRAIPLFSFVLLFPGLRLNGRENGKKDMPASSASSKVYIVSVEFILSPMYSRYTLELIPPQDKRLPAINSIYFSKRLFHIRRCSFVFTTFPDD
jgi:hypothetical protein